MRGDDVTMGYQWLKTLDEQSRLASRSRTLSGNEIADEREPIYE